MLLLSTGKKEAIAGRCLVAWDTVCRPVIYGGLGIKDLRLHGLALRTRWEWLRRTDPSRPWHGLPALRDKEALAVFQCFAEITVGNGESVMFWTDKWINGHTMSDIAPRVLEAVTTRRKKHAHGGTGFGGQ